MIDFTQVFVAGLLMAAPALGASKRVKVAGSMATLSTAASSIQCGQGQSLTYAIKTSDLPGVSLAKAQSYFRAFTQVAPSSNRLGSNNVNNNGVGSTRTYNITDGALKSTASITETLTKLTLPSGGSNLEQQYTSNNERYYSGSLTFYADYTSVTVGQPQGGSVFIQAYKNVCANSQSLANQALPVLLTDSLTFWINAIKAPAPSSVSSSRPVSSSTRPSSTVSLPPPNPTGSSISCKSGQYLTYAIQTQMDPGTSLATAQQYFLNWIGSAPSSNRGGSTGTNGIGSTRTWTVTDTSLGSVAPIKEVLTSVQRPASNGANLRLQWQITATQGYYGGSLKLFQSFSDLTIGQQNGGSVFLQYFINTCASDQSLANKALPQIIMDSLNFWNAAA